MKQINQLKAATNTQTQDFELAQGHIPRVWNGGEPTTSVNSRQPSDQTSAASPCGLCVTTSLRVGQTGQKANRVRGNVVGRATHGQMRVVRAAQLHGEPKVGNFLVQLMSVRLLATSRWMERAKPATKRGSCSPQSYHAQTRAEQKVGGREVAVHDAVRVQILHGR